MSDKYSIAFSPSQAGGHPHDLLAKLYREIGLSAVAAALEVARFPQAAEEPQARPEETPFAPHSFSEDLAA